MPLSGEGSLSIIRAVGQDAPNRNGNDVPSLRLSVPKPSWIVRTESNVRKMVRKKPDPPCVVCNGRGAVDCTYCRGRGRTNCVHLTMLPNGEWPKWCRDCGGSGLGLCSRCLGTGEYRHIMGFNFMKMDSDQNHKEPPQDGGNSNSGPHTAADRLLNEELWNDHKK
ncbi:hypothetical protein HS088_TW18G00257 [Tripterygium wilfordii]|uniref:Uncharacterized protein n=1 Tax=Tripterygium wilfordii TaxID=458696 RepID=A0A7J7CCH8_TRIWF|nr:chaperone protein DnaJ-like [Tripterygium wilfordii]KAF5731577.1 hypothetical protein HS088_TW18G00257 [Tripterygium wilfordii]